MVEDDVEQRVEDLQSGSHALAATVFRPFRAGNVGLVIVVGGPQCRMGSHRQHVELAREAARIGFPALIFDHRGIGDSLGAPARYFELEPDITTAVDSLMEREPAVRRVILWGLCDGATAAALYAGTDRRIAGIVLVNPWLEPNRGHARSRLSRYYAPRLFSRGFWHDLVRGKLDAKASLRDLGRELWRAMAPAARTDSADPPEPTDIVTALGQFSGGIHLLISTADITATGFLQEMSQLPRWRRFTKRGRIRRYDIADADHTCSDPQSHERLMSLSMLAVRAIAEPTDHATKAPETRPAAGGRETQWDSQ